MIKQALDFIAQITAEKSGDRFPFGRDAPSGGTAEGLFTVLSTDSGPDLCTTQARSATT
jgi:hypothetical protein